MDGIWEFLRAASKVGMMDLMEDHSVVLLGIDLPDDWVPLSAAWTADWKDDRTAIESVAM